MFSGGYLGRLIRINLSTRQYSIEPIPEEKLRLFLGARGWGAEWYSREVSPQVRPLDRENKMAFFTGPMTGTPLVSTTKFELTTKGLETGRYLCSNSSGNFGPRLREAGFDGLILEGVSKCWTALIIEKEDVKFLDDDGWQGLDPMEARARLLDQLPERLPNRATMRIKPAQENTVAF